ncbi:MAG: site-specific DNA-methyltransferase, partial [Frankia sp.]
GAPGLARVVAGDARNLPDVLAATTLGGHPSLAGRVALVLTSPPYGSAAHGQVTAEGATPVRKRDYRYSADPGNLAHQPLAELLDGFGAILTGAAGLLRPGGTVAVTTRPFRSGGELVDLPGAVITAAGEAGLVFQDRAVALLAGLRGTRVVSRGSFFAMHNTRALQTRGIPAHVVAHEDVLIFTRP